MSHEEQAERRRLRDEFARAALPYLAVATGYPNNFEGHRLLARDAYDLADAMLEARGG